VRTEEKRELPPFGPYTMVPMWFYRYCQRLLSPSAITLYGTIRAMSRWKTNKPCSLPMKSLQTITGLCAGTVIRALNELEQRELITCAVGETTRDRNSYMPVLYTPEQARDKFKDMQKTALDKIKRSSARKNRALNPRKRLKKSSAFEVSNPKVSAAGEKVISIARAK
jgi:DNA-binding transcriptional MocR family regulator